MVSEKPSGSPWFPHGLPFQHPALGQRAQAEAAADRRRPGGPEEVPVHRDLRVGHGTAAAAGDHRHLAELCGFAPCGSLIGMRSFHGLRGAGLVCATLRETGGTGGGERRSNLLASNQEYAWLRL